MPTPSAANKVPVSSSSPSQPLLAALAKTFDPQTLEAQWRGVWEASGLGKAGYRDQGVASTEAIEAGRNFAIQLPPPNVTGTLHMGHAFNQTIMDALARYHRMRGFNTLWLPGTDHAGIATQLVVESQLREQGVERQELGREAFTQKIWEWKEKSGSTITTQMRRLGASVDWSREYFTMDRKLSEVVTETFVQLYEQGLIYRGKRLVNWDPVLKTAVSDLEVESVPTQGKMHYICYPFSDGEQVIEGAVAKGMTIATTRPETMLADGALAVHPEDPRYQHLVGKFVDLPLCDRRIPIIADTFVDRTFGSGCVKVTGAHDFNDYACSQRHNLPLITIFTLEARLNENAPAAYQGMDRLVCRQAVLEDLQTQGLLLAVKPHEMMLPICARTGQVVEPMLTEQWFVAMSAVSEKDPTQKSIAQKAVEAVRAGAVEFVPGNWVNTFNQWMAHIEDWCISRQLWWGHQIPAWYDEAGNVYVAKTQEQAQAQATAKMGAGVKLTRDPDVLDTWYSSALVPFSTLREHPADYDLYLPSSVLVTGYDIIFFWVARMIMMTLHFTARVPFRHVYIHGLVRDAQGRKMSKSEGNVLDPVDLIDGIALEPLLQKRTTGLRRPQLAPQVRSDTIKEFPQGIPGYGADALRFTFAALANLGRSINFDSKRCEGYRNFCNKLWNATRFVLMHCEGKDCGVAQHATDLGAEEGVAHPQASGNWAQRWIVSTLQRVEAQVAQGFSEYRLDHVAQAIYEFVWSAFCDWYVEIAKVQLQTGDEVLQRATRCTLVRVLEAILRLAHPVIPFITEELWQKVAQVAGRKDVTSISVAPYPVSQPERMDVHAEQAFAQLKSVVDVCRNLRGELNIPAATRLPLNVFGCTAQQADALRSNAPVLQALARLTSIALHDTQKGWDSAVGASAVAVLSGMRLSLSVEIDVAAEVARLTKEVARLTAEADKASAKLGNAAFVSRAPAAVIEQERLRVQNFTDAIDKHKTQLARLNQS